MKRLEVGQDFFLGVPIQGRKRFIHQKQLRLSKKRPANGDALAFTTRQITGTAIQQVRNPHKVDNVRQPDAARESGLYGPITARRADFCELKDAGKDWAPEKCTLWIGCGSAGKFH